MNRSFLSFLCVALVVALTSAAQATITINLGAGTLTTADGVTPLSPNSTFTLLQKSNGATGDLADGSTFAPDGYTLLAIGGTDDGAGPGTIFTALTDLPYAGLTQGAELWLVWYDLAYDAGATGPGSGIGFNTYHNPVADPIIGSDPWFVPADGALITLNFLSGDFGGTAPASAFATTQTTTGGGGGPTLLGQFVKFSADAPTMPQHGSDVVFDPNPISGGHIKPELIVDVAGLNGGVAQTQGAIVVDGLINLPVMFLLDLENNTGLTLQQIADQLNGDLTNGDDNDGDGDTFSFSVLDGLLADEGFDLMLTVNDALNIAGDNYAFEFDFTDFAGLAVERVAVIPTPMALPAGLAMLGGLAMRRRR